jgi:hypothetical protein
LSSQAKEALTREEFLARAKVEPDFAGFQNEG